MPWGIIFWNIIDNLKNTDLEMKNKSISVDIINMLRQMFEVFLFYFFWRMKDFEPKLIQFIWLFHKVKYWAQNILNQTG